jgi:hypothetical protein
LIRLYALYTYGDSVAVLIRFVIGNSISLCTPFLFLFDRCYSYVGNSVSKLVLLDPEIVLWFQAREGFAFGSTAKPAAASKPSQFAKFGSLAPLARAHRNDGLEIHFFCVPCRNFRKSPSGTRMRAFQESNYLEKDLTLQYIFHEIPIGKWMA